MKQKQLTPALLVVVIMVKNEAGSLENTLLPFVKGGVKHFFVFDTGSTDNTVEIANTFFEKHQLEGIVSQEPFIDFAASRNRALELAEEYFHDSSFIIMPDAEWYITNAAELLKFCDQEKDKKIPLYLIKLFMGSLDFATARIMRTSARVRFKGVVHEVPELPTGSKVPDSIYFDVKASSHGIEKSKKRWYRDKDLLLKEHNKNPTDPRTAFYLAQTLECLGELKEAYKCYQLRSTLNGWSEENFITLFRLGNLAERMFLLKLDPDITWQIALDYHLKAFAYRPQRVEPLVRIADYYWRAQSPQNCFLFIRYAYDAPYPKDDLLFVEKEMYVYSRYEIMSRCAWYMGQFALGATATHHALKVRPDMVHLQNNLKLYQQKLMSFQSMPKSA